MAKLTSNNVSQWAKDNPEIAYLDPTSALIKMYENDPIVKALIGEFNSAYSIYSNFNLTDEYNRLFFNGQHKQLNEKFTELKLDIKKTYWEIHERIESIDERKYSRDTTEKTFYISLAGALAALAAALISYFKN